MPTWVGYVICVLLGASVGCVIFSWCCANKLSESKLGAADRKLLAERSKRVVELQQLNLALEECNELLATERNAVAGDLTVAKHEVRTLKAELARIKNWQEQHEKVKED